MPRPVCSKHANGRVRRDGGDADETRWARILRTNLIHHHGHPPPRRLVDGRLIRLR